MSSEEDVSNLFPGAAVVGSPTTTSTFVGKTRTFAGLSTHEWIFVIVSFFNIAVCIALTIYRIVIVDSSSTDFTLAIVILVNAVFCVFYVVHGLLREKEFEIYAYCAAVLVILTYCSLEYGLNSKKRTTIKLARLVVAAVLGPINVVVGVLVARKFGWLEFKIVGASEELQYMYREVSRFTSMLKFDLQLSVTFAILVFLDGSVDTTDKVLIGVGIPLAVFLTALGWVTVRKENKIGVVIFSLLELLQPAYVIYKLYLVYRSEIPNMGSNDETYKLYLLIIIVSGAIALLVRCLVYFELYRVTKNFNRGLRERAFLVDERTSLLAAPRRR